ncbi:Homeobox protein yox1 [Saxophila tyrrhenica]|uniref:Homeobox protein yox1 n=1 Tax=Saxophila tyrrhenica TaxID=1690608 RepID=A0AAV9PBL1_9PEZI|nr:Homeobox protein yox1 [Saxophila tyrrhenica]
MDVTSVKRRRSSSPSLRPSSASGSDNATRPNSQDSQPRSSQIYAFLNHSTETVSDNLPPNVDDKPLARQRRRRTSPEDQAILEAAYAHNSKPDKAARIQLAQQVALGEKEVQIWFQNRRQSSRRKSRPLLPHELAQYQLYRSSIAAHDASSEALGSSFSGYGDASFANEPPVFATSHHVPEHHSTTSHTAPHRSLGIGAGPSASGPSHAHPDGSAPSTGPERVDHFVNRRSEPFLHDLQLRHAHHAFGALPAEASKDVKRSSSFMRLSMNSEGAATVVTKDSSSPSPPRPQPGHEQVAVTSNAAPIASALPPLKRTSSGRSRDSRAWEFWCDKDAREELTDKAEKDASGSAADAIGLLRSTSGRSILGAIPSKRNSLLSRQSASFKRSKLDMPKPALQKASTSNARLQNERRSQPATKAKPSLYSTSTYIPGNESDKENWSPDGRQGQQQGGENDDPEADPEIAAFMKNGRKSSSVSGAEELDCVQGLLSLSQGNWR